MSYEEVVVGFDTRVPPDEVAAGWADEERRHTFLLRPEVPYPLSVDEAVWSRRGSRLDAAELVIQTPRFRTLEEALAAAGPDEVVIAITTWRGPGEPELLGGVPATGPDPAWRRLGWDVADGVFPSGISNCGYAADEVLDWRAQWADRFSDVHLFDDLPTAFAFRDRTDRRVPEHAPFSVIGLYLVRGALPAR